MSWSSSPHHSTCLLCSSAVFVSTPLPSLSPCCGCFVWDVHIPGRFGGAYCLTWKCSLAGVSHTCGLAATHRWNWLQSSAASLLNRVVKLQSMLDRWVECVGTPVDYVEKTLYIRGLLSHHLCGGATVRNWSCCFTIHTTNMSTVGFGRNCHGSHSAGTCILQFYTINKFTVFSWRSSVFTSDLTEGSTQWWTQRTWAPFSVSYCYWWIC